MDEKTVRAKIIKRMKAEGLDIAEEYLGKIVGAIFGGVRDYVVESPNKFDDIALAVLPPVEAMILKEIDKIDGEVG